MLAVSLRGLIGRKLRAVLTAFSVLLGVMLISGTYVFTDTINRSFDGIFAQANQGTDVVVLPEQGVGAETGDAEPLDASVVERVRAVPGVSQAVGDVDDFAALFDRNGKPVASGGAPTLLFAAQPEPFDPYTYEAGRAVRAPDELVVDSATAAKLGAKVGERVKLAAREAARDYTLVGIGRFGDQDSGGATTTVLALEEAQRITGKVGKVDRVTVAAAEGTSPAELRAAIDGALPGPLVVRTGEQEATEQSDSIAEDLAFLNTALLAFGGIALFVGGFIIFNTFSITVAQRAREFASLRTLGASRGQVLRSVLVEALIIGLVASVVGLGLGVLAAKGIDALFGAVGVDLPQNGTVVATRTVIVAVVVGTLMTLLASLGPALRATRVSPLVALREAETPVARKPGPIRTALTVVVVLAGVGALLAGLFGGGDSGSVFALLAAGAVGLFLGVALFSSRLVPPLALAVGWPVERAFGLPGRLARENAARNPGRTAVTAAALMIGLALVTFVTIFAAGLRSSIDDAVDGQIAGDLVLTNLDGFSAIPAAAARAAAQAEGVAAVSTTRTAPAEVPGADGDEAFTGVDPATAGEVFRLERLAGPEDPLDGLADGEVLLESGFAEARGVAPGGRITVRTPTNRAATLSVRATFEDKGGLFRAGIVTNNTAEKLFGEAETTAAFVAADEGQDASAVRGTVERALGGAFPTVKVQDNADIKEQAAGQVNTILGLFYALLSLSVIVSLFGIVNTLVLSIVERTRELGMLRAVGSSRRQVRRMIRYESVITALIGATLGLALGLFLGVITTVALGDEGFTLSLPVGTLLVLLVLTALAGVLAAVLPARRASRLNVLEALGQQ